jgi:hypothetical protein
LVDKKHSGALMCTFGDVPMYKKGLSLMLGAQLPAQRKGGNNNI